MQRILMWTPLFFSTQCTHNSLTNKPTEKTHTPTKDAMQCSAEIYERNLSVCGTVFASAPFLLRLLSQE